MIFADAEAKRPVRQLVNEFGVEFEAPVSELITVVYRELTKFMYRDMRSEIIHLAIQERT